MTQPQLEEPKEPEKEPEKTMQPEEKAQALLAELEKAGIQTPEQIAGAIEASKHTGKMAQHLGETRSENENLRREIELLRRSIEGRQKPEQRQDEDELDLKGLIRNELRSFYQHEIIEPQTRAQQQFHDEMAQVMQDEDYPIVAEAFHKHLYSPAVQAKLVRGETSVTREFDRTARAFTRAMLGKAAGTLREFTKKPEAPHMESSTSSVSDIPKQGDNKQLKDIHSAVQKGAISSDSALQAIVNASLFGNPNGPVK